ncbi:GntR family transcriptional regulator [Cereibacter azotoformans]|uniref:GntR family transcriptional regulator n=1 Tax=Cereibacter azotoformans TaxID=43057 RepID=UPI000E35CD57|nr:GntR family transcriptional regulator [Cereibacter azotoformans]AXQ93956.1 GntR family transcriptional regulator [Cereibacter sphaeroides]UIJ29475.1 GntR family transcriptional regulator [Cereibacter azotoformans]
MSAESLAQTAYRRIRDDIVEGRIAPNTILTERDLAERLGISRTPLRSALSVLEREQVIERMANGAHLVRRVSVEQLLDIIQLRLILERAAARRAAAFGMTPELAAARAAQLRYLGGAEMDFETFWQDDGAFHRAVALAAGLTLLPGLLSEQRAIVRRSTIIRTHTNFADQAREHIAVIDAIASRNAAAASAAMSVHFERMRARTLGWLDKD